MTPETFNPRVLKFCAWMGPAFTAMWLIGAGPLTGWHFVPPPSAAMSATETVRLYTQHLTGVRIGCVFMIFSSGLYGVWGVAVSMYARTCERGRPVLFYVQIVSMACCAVVVMLIGFFWGVAAFRPGQVDPQITQALNDVGWFGVLFTGAPFTVWAFALAAAVFLDKSERPVFPRWSGYLNIWAGALYVEASLLIFFKTGPFSQNGLLVFYVPVIVFFIWICALSWLTFRAIDREAEQLHETATASSDPALVAV